MNKYPLISEIANSLEYLVDNTIGLHGPMVVLDAAELVVARFMDHNNSETFHESAMAVVKMYMSIPKSSPASYRINHQSYDKSDRTNIAAVYQATINILNRLSRRDSDFMGCNYVISIDDYDDRIAAIKGYGDFVYVYIPYDDAMNTKLK